MRYELVKESFRELLVSERVLTVDGKGLVGDVVNFFAQKKYDFRILANLEQGTKNGLWHCHIILHFPTIAHVPIATTFRSQIQKHFGKSNVKYDWKYRCVRKSLNDFLRYTMKDGNCAYNKDFPIELYNKYKGTYCPKSFDIKVWLQEVQSYVKRCDDCVSWNRKLCKRDVANAVLAYYDAKNKKYIKYNIINDIRTVYYRSGGDREELIDSCLEKV